MARNRDGNRASQVSKASNLSEASNIDDDKESVFTLKSNDNNFVKESKRQRTFYIPKVTRSQQSKDLESNKENDG